MGRKFAEESKQGAPEWIVTFSDMITLLLTFFVLLQSMAKVQVDKHKFETGQAALYRAFTSSGVAGLQSETQENEKFEHPKIEYAVEEGKDEPENRAIDTNTEMLRRIVMDIEKMAKITPSPIDGVNKTITPTPIRFASEQTDLSSDTIGFLNSYCRQIESAMMEQSTLFVLGIAANEKTEKKQWLLSAKRAAAVAGYIQSQMPQDSKLNIYSWGAGPGGDWVGTKGLVSAETEIMIATMSKK